jgi:hypothetical protein
MSSSIRSTVSRSAGPAVLILGLCALSLAAPQGAEGALWLSLIGSSGHTETELAPLADCPFEECDGHMASASLFTWQRPAVSHGRDLPSGLLHGSLTLRPIVPPPESPCPA